VIEIRAGERLEHPGFRLLTMPWNFGDEVCEILCGYGEMHTEEFKTKLDRDSMNPMV